jgi:predicted nucleic acid-binding protein
MRFLLDTNVISETAKPKPNSKVMNWLLQHEANCGIPAMAISERAQGIFALAEPRKTHQLESLKTWVEDNADRIIPFDGEAAMQWGEYVQSPTLKQNPKGIIDTQIAAISMARNLILVTRNVEDFPGIQVLNPWD